MTAAALPVSTAVLTMSTAVLTATAAFLTATATFLTATAGVLTTTAAVLSVSTPARASVADPPGPVTEHHHVGNGRRNRNIVSVRSPTHNRGYQHTSSSNAGGANSVQNALCRHSTVCNVTQKVIIVTPERPAPPPPAVPESGVEVVRPQVRPEIRRPVAEQKPVNPTPFMYMGPYGFVMMASDSSTPLGFRTDDTGAFGVPGGLFS